MSSTAPPCAPPQAPTKHLASTPDRPPDRTPDQPPGQPRDQPPGWPMDKMAALSKTISLSSLSTCAVARQQPGSARGRYAPQRPGAGMHLPTPPPNPFHPTPPIPRAPSPPTRWAPQLDEIIAQKAWDGSRIR